MNFPEKNAQSTPLDMRRAFLAPGTKVQPLVDRWYAWSHLLAPVQQALNLAHRYLPTARSFADSPAVHVTATADPAMFGGPFMALPPDAASAVASYIESVESSRSEALAFVQALQEFDLELQVSATGFSLDSFKEALPDILKGRVELVYDAHNHPKVRILEEMFLIEDLGHRAAQEVFISRRRDIDRPFFLSDLKTDLDDGLFVRAPFGSEAVQRLCSAHHTSVDLLDLADALKIAPEALAPYFTSDEPPPPAARYAGDGVRIRYFGHACVLIETDQTAILVDPSYAQDRLPDVDHLTFADLPDRIDFVVLSHGHQDHFSPEILMQIRDRVGIVVAPAPNQGDLADPSMKRILQSLGYERIDLLSPLDVLAVPGGRITTLPFSGEHSDLDVHSKQCFQIELKGRKIAMFIDSDAIDLDVYERLNSLIDSPDVMFVGMECFGAPLTWLYGPVLSAPLSKKHDQSRRLSGANSFRAWRLAQQIRPKQSYVYAIGQEAWMRSLMGLNYSPDSIQLTESADFVERCLEAGIPSARLHNQLELTL